MPYYAPQIGLCIPVHERLQPCGRRGRKTALRRAKRARVGPGRRIRPAGGPHRSANPGWTSTRRKAITMSTTPLKSVLITGANAGIGKEVARQLASRPEIAHIYLACRNRDRATAARAELEAATGRRIFDIVVMDVA